MSGAPAELQRAHQALARLGLVAVPAAARELLEHAVDDRLELDRCRRLLKDTAGTQGDRSMPDLIAVLQHRLQLVELRYQTAEKVIHALRRGDTAAREIQAWEIATNSHIRRST